MSIPTIYSEILGPTFTFNNNWIGKMCIILYKYQWRGVGGQGGPPSFGQMGDNIPLPFIKEGGCWPPPFIKREGVDLN